MMLFIAALFALIFVLLFTPIIRWVSLRFHIGDKSDEVRKIHKGTTPTLGGIGIYAAIILSTAIFGHLSFDLNQLLKNGFWAVLVGGSMVFVVGILDDTKNLNFQVKFSAQIIAAVFTTTFGRHYITDLFNPFGINISLPESISFLLTVFWIVGLCNAINLIDGLDGLASGVVGIAASIMTVISLMNGEIAIALFYAILLGAMVGFLRYNFNPAKIFMGDTGALFIGYLMACLPIFYSPQVGSNMIWIQVLILGFPITDTLLAPFRRLLVGSHPFKADREHIHHRLINILNLSHKEAVLKIYSVSFGLGLSSLVCVALDFYWGELARPINTMIIVTILILAIIGLRRLGYFTVTSRRPSLYHFKTNARRAKDAVLEHENVSNNRALNQKVSS